MSIKLGRISVVLFVFSFFLINPLFAKQMEFENSNYIAEWNFKDDFKGDINDPPLLHFNFNETYYLFLYVQNHIDEDLLFSISDGNKKLSFDFKSLIQKSKLPRNIRPRIAFYEIANGISILYYSTLGGGNGQAYCINFDFQNEEVQLSEMKRISDLFAYTFSYSYSSLLNHIYSSYFGNTDLTIPQELKFNSYGEGLCGHSNDRVFTTLSNNVIKQDFLCDENKSYYSYLDKKVSEKILDPKSFIRYYDKISISDFSITTNSFLKENTVTYDSENMKSFSNTPWCPSINIFEEEILIKTNQNIGGLYFCNGFFRENREDLYFKNNRVKEIEIIYPEDYGLKHNVVLIDTSEPQFISLLNIECTEIKIRVISVYEGSTYNDTCINAIYPVGLLSETDYFKSQK